MRDHELGQTVGERKTHEPRIILRLELDHRGDTIHVPEHEMTAKAIACLHRALEVHVPPRGPFADGGALERRRHRGDGEPSRPVLADGETRTIDRDTLAIHEIV